MDPSASGAAQRAGFGIRWRLVRVFALLLSLGLGMATLVTLEEEPASPKPAVETFDYEVVNHPGHGGGGGGGGGGPENPPPGCDGPGAANNPLCSAEIS